MKTRVIVSAVIEKDNHLLFGRKRKNVGPYPDTWHLIGGGVEPDESLEDGIKREIREEANIEVEILERLGFDDDFEPDKHGELTHYIFLVYKVKYISGEAKADDDLVDLKWFSKNELPESEFNRPTLKLFKKLGYVK